MEEADLSGRFDHQHKSLWDHVLLSRRTPRDPCCSRVVSPKRHICLLSLRLGRFAAERTLWDDCPLLALRRCGLDRRLYSRVPHRAVKRDEYSECGTEP